MNLFDISMLFEAEFWPLKFQYGSVFTNPVKKIALDMDDVHV